MKINEKRYKTAQVICVRNFENAEHIDKPHRVMDKTYETALMFLIPDSNGIDKDVNYYQKQNSTIITKDNKTEWIHVR